MTRYPLVCSICLILALAHLLPPGMARALGDPPTQDKDCPKAVLSSAVIRDGCLHYWHAVTETCYKEEHYKVTDLKTGRLEDRVRKIPFTVTENVPVVSPTAGIVAFDRQGNPIDEADLSTLLKDASPVLVIPDSNNPSAYRGLKTGHLLVIVPSLKEK